MYVGVRGGGPEGQVFFCDNLYYVFGLFVCLFVIQYVCLLL